MIGDGVAGNSCFSIKKDVTDLKAKAAVTLKSASATTVIKDEVTLYEAAF